MIEDSHDRRRKLTTVMVFVLAFLVPLLTAAVIWLVVSDLQGRARDREAAREFVQQTVHARYDDCQAGEEIRAALRAQVKEGKRTDPLLYKLVPSLDTPKVHQIVAEQRARQLKAYEKQRCREYALAAVPPDSRDSYRVP